jgi:hypothetical protein
MALGPAWHCAGPAAAAQDTSVDSSRYHVMSFVRCTLYAHQCRRDCGGISAGQTTKRRHVHARVHARASMHTRTLGARGCPEVRLAWRRREWCGVAWRWAASDVPARQRCSLWLCDCARTAVLLVWRCPNATGDGLVTAGPLRLRVTRDCPRICVTTCCLRARVQCARIGVGVRECAARTGMRIRRHWKGTSGQFYTNQLQGGYANIEPEPVQLSHNEHSWGSAQGEGGGGDGGGMQQSSCRRVFRGPTARAS